MSRRLCLALLFLCATTAAALAPTASAGDPVLDGSGFDALDSAITLDAPPIFRVSLLAKSTTAQTQLVLYDNACAATRTLGAIQDETEALAGTLGFSLEGATLIATRAENIITDLRNTHPPSPCIPPGPPQLPG